MFSFSSGSLYRMRGINRQLEDVLHEAILVTPLDFGVQADGGLRSMEQQYTLFTLGKSQRDGVTNRSKHQDGEAVDLFVHVDGLGVTWEPKYYYMLAGCIISTANAMGVPVRWGGDWDQDSDLDDQTFNDLGHFELGE